MALVHTKIVATLQPFPSFKDLLYKCGTRLIPDVWSVFGYKWHLGAAGPTYDGTMPRPSRNTISSLTQRRVRL